MVDKVKKSPIYSKSREIKVSHTNRCDPEGVGATP